MSAPEGDVDRFTPPVRWVHGLTGLFMIGCILTAAVLYNGSLAVLVGHRYLVEQIHLWSGLAMPVPLLAGIASRSYRDDARRLNRFTDRDWAWLRSKTRRDGTIEVGKFNAGQKLNAAFTVGTIVVMLATGLIMRFPNEWPLSWRTGATFVHDWVYLAAAFAIAGHILYALNDSDSLRSMWSGSIPSSWARRHAPRWYEEQGGRPR
jgi:formate dehydrogenase subunit gamma